MEISKATIGILATVCVAAGAGGAYVASRGPAATPPAITDEAAPAVSPAPLLADGVEQSEAIVAENPATIAEAPALAPPSAASKPAPVARERERRPAPQRPAERQAAAESPRPAPVAEPPAALSIPVEAPRIAEVEPVRASEPQGPIFEDLVVSADSVIGLQVDTPISSDDARVEDAVVARVSRDVKVGDRVAIPAGSKAHGEVTLVERGGRLRDRARLGVRFTSIVLADGTRVPISTETVFREGDAPGNASAAKIGGGAIGGAIIGGILGGAKGAIIGGSAGAGAGTAAVMAGGRKPATLSSGSPVTVRLEQPATVTVEK